MRGARRWGGGGGFNVVLRDHTALLSSRCAASDLLHPDVPAAYCLGMGKKKQNTQKNSGIWRWGVCEGGWETAAALFQEGVR